MMDKMLNQRAQPEDRRPTILNKNDAYSSSSNYTQNIAYNQSHGRRSQNLDDPSVTYYYSTNSAVGNYSGSHSPTQVGSPNDEANNIGNYTQNIAYNQSHGRCSQNLDDPSVTYYYSTNSAVGNYSGSHSPTQVGSPNDEANNIGNYTQNIAYKLTGGGADDSEDAYYYSTNTAYGANAQGPYEVNVAYGVHLADSVVEGDGEIEYYYGTNDRQDPDPSSGFSGDIEAHEVYRYS